MHALQDHAYANEPDDTDACLSHALHTITGAATFLSVIGPQVDNPAQAQAISDIAGQLRRAVHALERWSARHAHAVFWFLAIMTLCVGDGERPQVHAAPVAWIETVQAPTRPLNLCCEQDL